MAMNDRLASWLANKTRGEVERDAAGLPVMSEASVRALCLQHEGYECEEINDKLYLHFQGFRAIGGLEKYTGLKCLYLESNGIVEVTSLGHLTELRCLYLQQNVIKSLAPPALDGLVNVVTLDVSQNMLTSLEGISSLVALQTLNASKNRIASGSSLSELAMCPQLASLDLRGNRLEEPEDVFASLDGCGKLTALYLSGNPMVPKTQFYRKAVLSRYPALTYLDERPVDEKERMLVAAWAKGGREAEKEALEAWREKQRERSRDQVRSWNEFKERVRAERAAEIELAKSEGREPPAPRTWVTYGKLDPAEEDARQERQRQLAMAEAEAERQAVLSNGIQMMGLEFAKETAARNGATFDGAAPAAAPEEPPAMPPTPGQVGANATPTCASGADGSAGIHANAEANVHADADANVHADAEANAGGKVQADVRADEPAKAEGQEREVEEVVPASGDEEAAVRQKRVEDSLAIFHAQRAQKDALKAAREAATAKEVVDKQAAQQQEAERRESKETGPSEAAAGRQAERQKQDEMSIDPAVLKTAVRDSLFDFAAAAKVLSARLGREIEADECRRQFAMSRKGATGQQPTPAPAAPPAAPQLQPGEDTDAADDNGRPMPRVRVEPPPVLPSCGDYDSSESEPATPAEETTTSAANPAAQDERPPSESPFAQRLTRKDVISSLHGNADHPLASADLSHCDFEELD